MGIILTKAAIDEINRQNKSNIIRLGVKAGGCNGYSYVFEYSDKINEKDHIFEFENIKIIIDPKSMLYLSGTSIDFVKGIKEHGFKIENPQINTKCGCGVSFNVK